MSKVPTFSRRQAEEVRADVRPLIGMRGRWAGPTLRRLGLTGRDLSNFLGSLTATTALRSQT